MSFIFIPKDAKPAAKSLYSSVIVKRVGYTYWYGRSYSEWVETKVGRLMDYLSYVYYHRKPINLQEMTKFLYVERLLGMGADITYSYRKYMWKPVSAVPMERFTDHKPSPFMRSFIYHVLEELKYRGYLSTGLIVEISDRMTVTDAVEKKVMPYAEKLVETEQKRTWLSLRLLEEC